MTTSRREFFKTAAMGAVGAGAAFGTVAAEAKAAAPSKYDIRHFENLRVNAPLKRYV